MNWCGLSAIRRVCSVVVVCERRVVEFGGVEGL